MEVLASRIIPDRQLFEMAIETFQDGESKLVLSVMPADTLEWRSAEYHINPSETDLLLDIVLYEPFIPEMHGGPSVIASASSIAEARAVHVNNVMLSKQVYRPQGPNRWKNNDQRYARLERANPQLADEWAKHLDTDALKCVRENHIMDPEVVVEKAIAVAEQRVNAFRARIERDTRPQASPGREKPADRAARFRAMRMTPTPGGK